MQKLTHKDLMSLEEYARQRSDFRARVMAHKKNRILHLGEHATLYFEDRLTMQYQIQEMLRAERIFEEQGIDEELNAYNPLIPDGGNLKATFMVEYIDIEERKQALESLIGIETRVWLQVEGFDKVYPIADEDLERETEEKTSSVHFLRFEFTPEMIAAAKADQPIVAGIDHENYQAHIDAIPGMMHETLVADFS